MNKNLMLLVLSCFLLLAVGCSSNTDRSSAAGTDADNTARNAQDRDGDTQTSGDQAENATDRQITADVRQALVHDKSLSMNAHNVKIITTGGVVTLRGPVNSAEEKAAVESKAKSVTGVTGVNDLLEVKEHR